MKLKSLLILSSLFFASVTMAAKPVVTPGPTTVIGQNVILTGTVTDIDGDIEAVSDLFGFIQCDLVNYGWWASYYCAPDYNFSVGYNEIAMMARDRAENFSDPAYVSFTIDPIEPSAPVMSGVYGNVIGDSVTITGAVTDADGDFEEVKIVVGGMPYELICDYEGTGDAGAFTCNIEDLVPGTYYFYLIASDEAGNVSPETIVEVTIEEELQCITATNNEHLLNGRAYKQFVWFSYVYKAVGSDDDLGLMGYEVTSVELTGEDNWEKVDSCE